MSIKSNETNHFELSCGQVAVTYSTTSIVGQPLFNYRDQNVNLSFLGDQIQVEKSSIGQLISVQVEAVPDLRTVWFTVILPVVKVVPGSAGIPITVPGLRTTLHTSLTGPPDVGPDKTYEVCTLAGTAQAVAF